MTPYYDDGTCTIYHGDCRDVLPRLGQSTVDLIVTDPPYGISYKSNRGNHHSIVGDNGDLDVAAALTVACRSLRRGRHAYVFGAIDLASTPLTAQVELIWDKGIVGMGNLELPWATSHEPITFAVYELSQSNREKGYGRLAARLRKGSVLRVQREISGATTRHPTEKPVGILRQLIESSSIIGETVLDPFMGVGSTLEAAKLEDRKAIGIEIEERYCEIAVTRLGQQTLDFAVAGAATPKEDT
jgi:DNA modification methylase